jgi:hypothetical protein
MGKTAETNKISLKFSRKSRAQISDYTGSGFNPFYLFNWENTIIRLRKSTLGSGIFYQLSNHFPSQHTTVFSLFGHLDLTFDALRFPGYRPSHAPPF